MEVRRREVPSRRRLRAASATVAAILLAATPLAACGGDADLPEQDVEADPPPGSVETPREEEN